MLPHPEPPAPGPAWRRRRVWAWFWVGAGHAGEADGGKREQIQIQMDVVSDTCSHLWPCRRVLRLRRGHSLDCASLSADLNLNLSRLFIAYESVRIQETLRT